MKNNSNIVTLIIYKEKIMLEDTLPKPLTTGSLDDLLVASNGNEQDYNVFIGHNDVVPLIRPLNLVL